MKYNSIYILFLSLLLLTGCSDRTDNSSENKVIENTKTLNTRTDEWTYISLETGQIAGTSKVGDEEADRQWSQRKDWDIAIYDKYIRTNSGTSGNGKGGITVTDTPYEQLSEAPEGSYAIDSKNTEIW